MRTQSNSSAPSGTSWLIVGHEQRLKVDGWAGRYDAHPMAILTSAFAYLGSYYSEANPSLQGASLLSRSMLSANASVNTICRSETLHDEGQGVAREHG